MPARTKARKRALDILFEAEIRGVPVLDLLAERSAAGSQPAGGTPPVSGYAAELVRGVQAHRERIDELLARYSQGWALDRMPAVDRNILRIGAYELLWGSGVPDGVVISEAVLLARDLSTDGSPAFVNGLLARLLEVRPELGLEARPELELESGPELELESGPELELESGPELELESGPELELESGPELELESGPELELEATPEPETEPAPDQ